MAIKKGAAFAAPLSSSQDSRLEGNHLIKKVVILNSVNHVTTTSFRPLVGRNQILTYDKSGLKACSQMPEEISEIKL